MSSSQEAVLPVTGVHPIQILCDFMKVSPEELIKKLRRLQVRFTETPEGAVIDIEQFWHDFIFKHGKTIAN